jgi:hypothetical protein
VQGDGGRVPCVPLEAAAFVDVASGHDSMALSPFATLPPGAAALSWPFHGHFTGRFAANVATAFGLLCMNGMKALRHMVSSFGLMGVTLAVTASIGCATHERVVVRDRPEVVRVAPAPVVQERVVVRP